MAKVQQTGPTPGNTEGSLTGSSSSGDKLAARLVSIDTSFEDILALDEKGTVILWDDSPGRLPSLSGEQVAQLGAQTRQMYGYAKMAEKAKRQSATPQATVAKRMQASGGAMRADRRLRVEGLDPQVWDTRWERPEDVEDAIEYAGFSLVEDAGVTTTQNKTGVGVHKITKRGIDELVLLKRPVAAKVQAEKDHREWVRLQMNEAKEAPNNITRAAGHKKPGSTVEWVAPNTGATGVTTGNEGDL